MNLTTRLKIYSAVIGAYLVFGFIEGFYDIFPWGAVIIGVCIIIAEVGTYISIRKRR
jgi:hypothetical protein